MDLTAAAAQWATHGFVFIPAYLESVEIAAAQQALPKLFPLPGDFHADKDPDRNRVYREGQQTGIVSFPYIGAELGLLATHPKLLSLAAAIIESDDLRIYGCEAWAKYSGAVDYEQPHHRDLVGHTTLVASSVPEYRQVEMFVYLHDVEPGGAPTRYVSRTLTDELPLVPRNRTRADSPELYDAEVSHPGPAGSVVAWSVDTFHRAVDFEDHPSHRFTLQANFRSAKCEWMARTGWGYSSNAPEWDEFVSRASVDQLRAFGFPPPGHPFWTSETLDAMAVRYPNLDLLPWQR